MKLFLLKTLWISLKGPWKPLKELELGFRFPKDP